ncbi:energy transducer TonB [Fulvivirga lutea]|uniref:TonB C-terminal domain-containing protein n=1 Tax=Fulvivirga lutea TaxID=2810512 RepID=A0A974WF83_9BACT|nr:hypothetical protein [Fulvivirga lutea]QSE95912.1 hypothetical protein JR347_09795 [Fulvivirga lutea]
MKYILAYFLLSISSLSISQSKNTGQEYLEKGKNFIKQNNIDSANFYLQLAVQNRNAKAINLLKEELKIDIEYHDIMPLLVVDEDPKFLYKEKEYPINNKDYSLNPKLVTQIRKALNSSDEIRKSEFTGQIFIELVIDKEGNFAGSLKKGTGSELLDKNIIEQLNRELKFKPAIYKGRNTGAWAYMIPIGF